jgi:hypothetical protein
MRVEGNVIIFSSTPEYYMKEIDGRKPNTIRLIPSDEWNRFMGWCNALNDASVPMKISIEMNTKKRTHYFVRDVKDISFIGELLGSHLVIISWRHHE